MATVIITLKIMPESPETDLVLIQNKATPLIQKTGAQLAKTEHEPVAFGLKALKLILIADEEKGSTDALEAEIKKIDGVQSVDVVDVRRAIG